MQKDYAASLMHILRGIINEHVVYYRSLRKLNYALVILK